MAIITGGAPAGRVVYRFRARITFHAFETASDYVAGEVYNVRAGNDLLHGLVQTWITENKVEAI
jgi:hypothetical protein